MTRKYIVHVEDDRNSKPRPHEYATAEFLAEYFQSDIVFLKRHQSKNPDIYVLKTNVRWELKAPTGSGKHTIQNNLRDAGRQSENIILDFYRIGLSEKQGISRVNEFIRTERHGIKRLKILTKHNGVIDVIKK
ncbi:hypothetical protein IJH06_01570 [Candidatus Saccharibacteria bacterium]|nr:hypothetical protein [Candidatus Saccharibacteria bacterium]